MRKSLSILFSICMLVSVQVNADNEPSIGDTASLKAENLIMEDDPIISMLDSLINLAYFNRHQPIQEEVLNNVYGFHPDSMPIYSDSIISLNLEKLNTESPFDYVYNADVRKYIELYTKKRRYTTKRMLSLASLYFPLFEEKLDKYNLPVELKYLAIVESALNPVAVSRAGAVGLWQFMPGTGKLYGLDITRRVDERRDPYMATEAACQHFIDLYERFGDWTLVLAAYNAGSGNVQRAMRRSGKATYWEIRPYLPGETKNYVPAFIAVSYMMTYHTEYNIFPEGTSFNYYELDTVAVKKTISLKHIADKLGMDVEELIFLNPALKRGVVYATAEKPWYITIPRSYVGDYLTNEKALYETYKGGSSSSGSYNSDYHWVRKGESLGLIARKYGCSVTSLKKANGLRSNLIHPGQKLKIP